MTLSAGITATSCMDTSQLESDLAALEDRVAALENTVAQVNSNAIAAKSLFDESTLILGCTAREDGTGYDLDLSDGTTVSIYVGADGGGITPVIGIDSDGNWTLQVGNGEPEIIEGSSNAFGEDATVPQVRVNDEGYWEISTDGGTSWKTITDSDGNPVYAGSYTLTNSFFSEVSYNESTGELDITLSTGETLHLSVSDMLSMEIGDYEDGQPILLGQTLTFNVTFSDDVVNAAFSTCPDGWRAQVLETEDGHSLSVTSPASGSDGEYEIQLRLESAEHYIRSYTLTFQLVGKQYDANAVQEWNDFLANNEDNVLLDFSYAGYMHGETAPPDVAIMESGGEYIANNGYTVYNVTDYGAIPDDGKSDREAFLAVLTEIAGEPTLNTAGDQLTFPSKNSAKAVIYFPEGNFILHTEEDDANGKSQSIIIRCGDLIMKGAGRDLTTLEMADPNQPSQGPSVMYSSPDMIQFKHNTGIRESNPVVLANVTGDSAKGTYSITVDAVGTDMTEDAWVCLYLKNSDAGVVAEELSPYTASSGWEIATSGVNVIDLHQIKSISGNTITFYEPLMHAVDADWGWQILRYQHYENVGIEDLCFAGHAKDRFDHHYSWEDDGAYKPVSMTRLTNSWMRRVKFDSVSEACSVIESANVSVYDVEIGGTRGHSAIRSQGSSRVFIGAVKDLAEGYRMDDLGHEVEGTGIEWTGQYHAVGVSKQSMGAVLWRNTWGYDSCFESHATQPRATLIDCCTGGWKRWRQGGDAAQMPNHLADLTVWNFENTTPYNGTWVWWDSGSSWWKFLPPIVVGFHGEPVTFDTEQTLRLSSNGTAVTPESLYEAQLRNRLGYVPAWLNALK